jgi:hypothetical protein
VSTGDQSGQAGNIQSRDFFPFEKRRVKVSLEHFSLFNSLRRLLSPNSF